MLSKHFLAAPFPEKCSLFLHTSVPNSAAVWVFCGSVGAGTGTADPGLAFGAGGAHLQGYWIKPHLHEHLRRENMELAQILSIQTIANKHLPSHHRDLFIALVLKFLFQSYLLMVSIQEKCSANTLGQKYNWLCCPASSEDLSLYTKAERTCSWSKTSKTHS